MALVNPHQVSYTANKVHEVSPHLFDLRGLSNETYWSSPMAHASVLPHPGRCAKRHFYFWHPR